MATKELNGQEKASWETAEKKPAAKKAAAVKKETVKKEAVKKETVKKETVKKETVKKPAAKKAAPAPKAKAARKAEIYVQSPYGGNITPEEILAKIPQDVDSCYVRVDQNTIWWVRGEETGAVVIW